MANSFTGTIDTKGQYKTINELTGLTLASGKTYTIQVQNIAELKIADAIFTLENEKLTLTQGEDDIYIRTPGLPAILTILENA